VEVKGFIVVRVKCVVRGVEIVTLGVGVELLFCL
jgi:hypothetical protein